MKKEKRVKKPLKIACNGQYYQLVLSIGHNDDQHDEGDERKWLI